MHNLNFIKNNKAVAAIEMAIVLPLLLIIVMAVLEFGMYFLKEQAASRAVSTASLAIQQNPNDGTALITMKKNGLGLMDLGQTPNFVCAKSYANPNQADTQSCTTPNQWDTSRPAGVALGSTYYVAVRAFAEHTPLTPIRSLTGAFPPDIDSRNVVPINASATHGILLLTSGSQWVVPAGITQVKATIIGGGGGANGGGNGGGSGAMILAYIGGLTPNTILYYSIGQGGTYNNIDGGDTTFNGLTAGGGKTKGMGGAGGIPGGAGGTVAPNQTMTSGTLNSYAAFNGINGAQYVGGKTNAYSGFGSGGDYNEAHIAGASVGTQGAVILEW